MQAFLNKHGDAGMKMLLGGFFNLICTVESIIEFSVFAGLTMS